MLFTAHQAADEFGLLITVGFAAQIFFHVYQNIGMTIALMPITGLPLPLISYGGTFLVMMMFGARAGEQRLGPPQAAAQLRRGRPTYSSTSTTQIGFGPLPRPW